MNYKKIIKNRNLRLFILRIFNFIPDRLMLKIQYRIKTGKKLDLKNPKRFTEKIQWYKLYYRNNLMISCVDKCDVRDYVSQMVGKEYLNKCLGVFDNYSQINYDNLPNSFVLKDTLGDGGQSVFIIKNKEQIDKKFINKKISKWTKINPCIKTDGREWPYYSGKKHRILIEEYIEQENGKLDDFKFFCFNGKVYMLYVMTDRKLGESVKVGIFNREFKLINVSRVGDDMINDYQIPKNFDKMIYIAETLSRPFPHVRVDLYNLNGKIIFGEMTFFGASGYMRFNPDEFDYTLGNEFELPSDKK